jgi:hypothetical protein
MKILCVHGIGHQDDPNTVPVWHRLWQDAVTQGLQATAPELAVAVDFLAYDDLFTDALAALGYADFAKAAWNLTAGAFRRPRGLFTLSDSTRWHAGMVVVWVNDADLRDKLCDLLMARVKDYGPDLVCAHSLGSLIAYDAFSRNEDAVQGKLLLTFGSQLGNTFVRGVFAGRVEPVDSLADWVHLYNPNDHVFTAPLDTGVFQTAGNFQQVETPFGQYFTTDISANHNAVNADDPDNAYLTHPQTRALVWPQIARGFTAAPVSARARAVAFAAAQPAMPTRRALLAGINAYPDPAQRLEGCVNDVFLMSSVLQECDFAAEDIRVVLDDRATRAGLLDRLHWLLDGTREGDIRFFYYSGHGAQLPQYGPEGKVDRIDPCLVPYDFAWTEETALTDRSLLDLYSLLPYGSWFMMVLDSCYSGGMTRGGTRVRGLDPPDDIRHRMLRWNAEIQMWEPRQLPPANRDLKKDKAGEQYVGESGAARRLGRAVDLRTLPDKEYDKERKELDHKGPYMPLVYEACGEREFAYEYQHGVTSYGAFTFAVAAALRVKGTKGKPVTYAGLLKEAADVLKRLQYDQHPVLTGPRSQVKTAVPWHTAQAGRST